MFQAILRQHKRVAGAAGCVCRYAAARLTRTVGHGSRHRTWMSLPRGQYSGQQSRWSTITGRGRLQGQGPAGHFRPCGPCKWQQGGALCALPATIQMHVCMHACARCLAASVSTLNQGPTGYGTGMHRHQADACAASMAYRYMNSPPCLCMHMRSTLNHVFVMHT